MQKSYLWKNIGTLRMEKELWIEVSARLVFVRDFFVVFSGGCLSSSPDFFVGDLVLPRNNWSHSVVELIQNSGSLLSSTTGCVGLGWRLAFTREYVLVSPVLWVKIPPEDVVQLYSLFISSYHVLLVDVKPPAHLFGNLVIFLSVPLNFVDKVEDDISGEAKCLGVSWQKVSRLEVHKLILLQMRVPCHERVLLMLKTVHKVKPISGLADCSGSKFAAELSIEYTDRNATVVLEPEIPRFEHFVKIIAEHFFLIQLFAF